MDPQNSDNAPDAGGESSGYLQLPNGKKINIPPKRWAIFKKLAAESGMPVQEYILAVINKKLDDDSGDTMALSS